MSFADPAEQTGSDAETFAVIRDHRPLSSRTEKWRMYHRRFDDGSITWHAYQPQDLDEPMFTAPKGDRYQGGRYGTNGRDGQKVLTELQLAMAKAAA